MRVSLAEIKRLIDATLEDDQGDLLTRWLLNLDEINEFIKMVAEHAAMKAIHVKAKLPEHITGPMIEVLHVVFNYAMKNRGCASPDRNTRIRLRPFSGVASRPGQFGSCRPTTSPTSLLTMSRVIRSLAMSASSWYMSCAGYVPPSRTMNAG